MFKLLFITPPKMTLEKALTALFVLKGTPPMEYMVEGCLTCTVPYSHLHVL